MKRIRSITAIFILILLCWLNWWVLPYLAIVRLQEKEISVPPTCLLLLELENRVRIGYRVIEDIQNGWSAVLAAWPYLVCGIILGFGPGYVIGELVRRKYAIDVASRKAVNSANNVMDEARNMQSENESNLLQIKRFEQDIFQVGKKLTKEREECHAVVLNAYEQIRIYEEKISEAEKSGRELLKAKETIKKLVGKISRLKKEKEDDYN
ncbi:MAG: hypothetical protein NTV58_05765 [Deltaproteobacteria bacterium]|nr:hypothetical protein [Deltaproteobacteria bacterium]